MAVAVPLRSDFDAAQLRALAKRSRDPDQTRRLLALAAIYDGASRTEAAQIGCVTLPIVRDWVLRWRLIDLIQWVWEEFRITISKQTLSRELRAMNYRKLSARPRHHAQSEAAVAAFKQTSPPVWRSLRRPRPAASP